jgi:hypothetical protein
MLQTIIIIAKEKGEKEKNRLWINSIAYLVQAWFKNVQFEKLVF